MLSRAWYVRFAESVASPHATLGTRLLASLPDGTLTR